MFLPNNPIHRKHINLHHEHGHIWQALLVEVQLLGQVVHLLRKRIGYLVEVCLVLVGEHAHGKVIHRHERLHHHQEVGVHGVLVLYPATFQVLDSRLCVAQKTEVVVHVKVYHLILVGQFLAVGGTEYLPTALFSNPSDVTDVIVSKIRQVLQEGSEMQMLFLDESKQVFLAVNALLGGFLQEQQVTLQYRLCLPPLFYIGRLSKEAKNGCASFTAC